MIRTKRERGTKFPYFHLALFLVWVWVLVTGLGGIDFGIHWDESLLQKSITWAVQNHTFLPQWVYYPAIMHFLGLASLLPEAMTGLFHFGGLKDNFFLALENISVLPEFLNRIRMSAFIVSSLAMVWIYLGVLKWRKNQFESFLASTLVGLSWEIHYHSRWFAPDAVMMQFGAMFLGFVLASTQSAHPKKILRWAAVACAFIVATKYNGGILSLVLFPVVWWTVRGAGESRKKALYFMCELGLIMVAFFILLNLKFVLDPKKSMVQFLFNLDHYRHMEHSGYNVAKGLSHLWKMGAYLFLVAFSRFPWISGFFSFLAISGMVDVVRMRNRVGILLGLVPLIYILLLSQNVVMVVRNILIVIPFLAIFSAVGYGFWESRISQGSGRRLLRIGVATCLFVNAGWLFYAMISIRNRDRINQGAQLASYIDARPNQRFLLSPMAITALRDFDGKKRSNLAGDWADGPEAVVFNTFEAKGRWDGRWKPNTFAFAKTWMGSYEVNINYYPTWLGNHKFVVMKASNAKMVFSGQIPSTREFKPHIVPGYD